MAFEKLEQQYLPRDNTFYRLHYHHVLYILMGVIGLLFLMSAVVFYQLLHRPVPQFNALNQEGKRMLLLPYDVPNQLPSTILRWASKAATVAYTFDFYNFDRQLKTVRPYFTDAGWNDYLGSVNSLIASIRQKQIFVNGVVAGTPVIANQGALPDVGYTWRVQIPFLVTYTGANLQINRDFTVVLTIVKVPTHVNPAGIGIDQFVMV